MFGEIAKSAKMCWNGRWDEGEKAKRDYSQSSLRLDNLVHWGRDWRSEIIEMTSCLLRPGSEHVLMLSPYICWSVTGDRSTSLQDRGARNGI